MTTSRPHAASAPAYLSLRLQALSGSCHTRCLSTPLPARTATRTNRLQVPHFRHLYGFQKVALLPTVSGPDTEGSNRSELNFWLCTFSLCPRGAWSSVAVGFVTAVQIVHWWGDVSLLSRRSLCGGPLACLSFVCCVYLLFVLGAVALDLRVSTSCSS